MGVDKVLGKPVVTIPGCPPNPYNFLSLVVHFLTFGAHCRQSTTSAGRNSPYSRLIHENCERRLTSMPAASPWISATTATAGAIACTSWAAGPETYANCPTIMFGDAGPAPGRWLRPSLHRLHRAGVGFEADHAVAKLKNIRPVAFLPRIVEEKGVGASLSSAAVLAAVAECRQRCRGDGRQNLGLSHKGRQMEETKPSPAKNGGLAMTIPTRFFSAAAWPAAQRLRPCCQWQPAPRHPAAAARGWACFDAPPCASVARPAWRPCKQANNNPAEFSAMDKLWDTPLDTSGPPST